MMTNKKPVGRPSQKDKEVLLIQAKDTSGKTKSKQFRSEKFNFEEIVNLIEQNVFKK